MKRVTLLTIFCCFLFEAYSQTAQEEIFADIHRSASNYYAYPEPDGKITPPPSGYKPFYLSHYARHGSRYLNSESAYEEPRQIMREAEQNGALTPLGKQTLDMLDSISGMAKRRYGELTPLGTRQHQGIAARMFKNYPEVYEGAAQIDARSTVVIRCILSMNAECLQLQSENSKLKFRNDASHHDMYYMTGNSKTIEKFRDTAGADSVMSAFKQKHIHPERLMRSLFNNSDYVKWKVDSNKFMTSLFGVAINMQSLDTELSLYPLFTKEECYDLWCVDNLKWYISHGPSPLNKGKTPYLIANLLENILNTADTCVVKKENSATLRFGHEVYLLPLASLLELGDCGYQTNDVEKVKDLWRSYQIFPMASNIQFIFFRKKNSNDILVKVTLNEKEMKLPVQSTVAPYYHWKDVEAYYRNKLAAFYEEKQ